MTVAEDGTRPWFWVRDAHTRVDAGQLSGTVPAANFAADCLDDARFLLSKVEASLAECGLDYAGALSGDWETLVSQNMARELLDQSMSELAHLCQEAREYAQSLAIAALVYSTAEQDTIAVLQACLGAGAECTTTGLNPLLSVVNYAQVLTGPGQDGKGRRAYTAMLARQQFLAAASALSPVSSQPVRASARSLASWCRDVRRMAFLETGIMFGPGVVVTGPGGSAWATPSASGARIVTEQAGAWPISARRTLATTERSLALVLSPTFYRPAPAGPFEGSGSCAPFKPGGTRSPSGADWSKPPVNAPQLLERLTQAPEAQGTGEIQILHHALPDGASSWTVVLRGTQDMRPWSVNPQDMLSNFQEVSGAVSDQQAAALAAMNLAGIAPGDAVEFVGHSQGGAAALSLASSPQVTEMYKIAAVTTAGAPPVSVPDLDVPVLAFENIADPVPSMGAFPASSSGNHAVIHFDDRALLRGSSGETGAESGAGGAHDVTTYVSAAAALTQQAPRDPGLADLTNWETLRLENMGLDQAGVETELLIFTTARSHIKVPSAGQVVRSPLRWLGNEARNIFTAPFR